MIRPKLALSCFVACLFVLQLASAATAATNDPLFRQLWGLQRVGAERAWQASRGAGVLIAVIDTGVDLSHPDLAAKLIPGESLVGEGTADDGHGHGTLIAGIAGAATGNREGIASVAPDSMIMPLRVFDVHGNSTSDRVTRAIRLATQTAARRQNKLVLNLSFVGPPRAPGDPVGPATILGDRSVRAAITEAADAGAAVVAASGNEGAPESAFDAPNNSGIIVVGAADQQDKCAPFTNYGPGLDILAPGVDILSTFWTSTGDKSAYAFADGTSLAVPFVSGAAALLMANGMTNVEAVNRILSTARGPEVSCRGEPSQYKHLDVAAALGVPRPRGDASFRSIPEPSPVPSDLILPAQNQPPEVVNPSEDTDGSSDAAPQPSAGSPGFMAALRRNPARVIALGMFLVIVVLLFLHGLRKSERPEP